METTSQSAPLTNLQLELLKLFAQNVADEDLIAIRRLIARYFAEKAMDLADQAWEEKGWTDEDAARLAHTKMRSPYTVGIRLWRSFLQSASRKSSTD